MNGRLKSVLKRTPRDSPPRFDEFQPDFFERNCIVFERAKAAFLLHLSQFSPFPVGPEWGQFLFAAGEPLAGGLDVDEVYRWRDAAWSDARVVSARNSEGIYSDECETRVGAAPA